MIEGTRIMRLRTLLFAVSFASGYARAAEFSGSPTILDGDTVGISGEKIRLLDIDAPETDQSCLDAAGKARNCGIDARDALDRKAGAASWTCEAARHDRYGRWLGTCSAGGV